VLRATISKLDLCTHGSQQPARRLNIANLRHIFQRDRFFRQQRRSHGWQGRILGPADPHRAEKWIATAYDKLIHRQALP
jgi:hypothetical protein